MSTRSEYGATGKGVVMSTDPVECPDCDGDGVVHMWTLSGEKVTEDCETCGGSGEVESK
jgi:DnaJ-class molecular chaperone